MDALLRLEVAAAVEQNKSSLFMRDNPVTVITEVSAAPTDAAIANGRSAPIASLAEDDGEMLARALQESLLMATRPTPDDEEARVQMAIAASEASLAEQRQNESRMAEQRLQMVLSALKQLSPAVASFVDEHCHIFFDGLGQPSSPEIEAYVDYRRAVDALLVACLAEVGVGASGVGDIANIVGLRARVVNGAASGSSLIQHLLAVKSFAAFRRLMLLRNEAIHREARAALGGSTTSSAAGPSEPPVTSLDPEHERTLPRSRLADAFDVDIGQDGLV